VDIYNNATNTWSTITLSDARTILEATVVGDKVYFAGGISDPVTSHAYPSKRIDVYDGASGNMTIATDLAEGKGHFASIAVGNKISGPVAGNKTRMDSSVTQIGLRYGIPNRHFNVHVFIRAKFPF
jgi:hypothetical protein